mmetsp:Transcript_2556/g.4587  ORF Transcript_2556/g.4587 Transcript_2556/m.4587 type:complete len:93 (-) Transcript_2556:1633-1911(-)
MVIIIVVVVTITITKACKSSVSTWYDSLYSRQAIGIKHCIAGSVCALSAKCSDRSHTHTHTHTAYEPASPCMHHCHTPACPHIPTIQTHSQK